jgi:hypothetical protein
MKNVNQDMCIDEGCLPVRANLKVLRRSDPDYGLTEDEIMDRNEFIRCYIMSEFELLLSIPKAGPETDFFVQDFLESAFNTHDFQRRREPFDRYAYAIRKVMEQAKDLALLHSSCSSPEGRASIHSRFENLIDRKFRDRLLSFAEQHEKARSEDRRVWLKGKVAEMNRRIMECRKIWESYAPPEFWDA